MASRRGDGRAPQRLDRLCSVYYILYMTEFGSYVRTRREALQVEDGRYSLRQVAKRVGIEPAYLSKIERGEMPPPSEATIRRIAEELGEDPDVMLALGGKVSADLLTEIRRRPKLFSEVIRVLRDAPEHAVLRIVREVREGDW